MQTLPRRFHLQRHHDITGVSGTGTVAVGVQWPDRTATVRWLGVRPSTVHWDCVEDALAVHGHGGATEIVWDDQEQPAANQAADVSPTAVFLTSPCDACQHTLNWHRNDVGCTVPLCVCGRFQPPAEEQPDVPAQRPAPAATSCSQSNPCEDGELCATHEEEQAHAEGDHASCGITCEVQMPSEAMRNAILYRAVPGSASMLDELLRRAATRSEGAQR